MVVTLLARIVAPWKDALRIGIAGLFLFTASAHFTAMKHDLEAQFVRMSFDQPLIFGFTLEMRYVGQAFEVPLELDAEALAKLDRAGLDTRIGIQNEYVRR